MQEMLIQYKKIAIIDVDIRLRHKEKQYIPVNLSFTPTIIIVFCKNTIYNLQASITSLQNTVYYPYSANISDISEKGFTFYQEVSSADGFFNYMTKIIAIG